MAQEQRDILDAQQAYFMLLIEERRRNPGEDMISAMVQAEVGGERLRSHNVIWTAGVRASPLAATLGVPLGPGGRVAVRQQSWAAWGRRAWRPPRR